MFHYPHIVLNILILDSFVLRASAKASVPGNLKLFSWLPMNVFESKYLNLSVLSLKIYSRLVVL